jgi:hypothetical protein
MLDCDYCGAAHATEAEATVCQDACEYEDAMQAQAEYEAEMRNERWFEDRGWAEAIAEREWEDARGVIQWEDARDAAEAAARRA